MTTRRFKKTKKSQSRKFRKGGATPGSEENLKNCQEYWHWGNKDACLQPGDGGTQTPRWKEYNYPGIQKILIWKAKPTTKFGKTADPKFY